MRIGEDHEGTGSALFEVLFRNLPGRTEEKYKNICQPIFEPSPSRIQV
jgi:hypothetical protein